MARKRRQLQSQRRQRAAAGHNHLGALLSQRLRMSKQGFSGFPPCTTEDQIKAPPSSSCYTSNALGGAIKVSPSLNSARILRVRQHLTVRVQTRAFLFGECMTENWKAVPGHEGRYEVSDHGQVRNLKKILVVCNVSSGYKAVSLGKNNSKLVHRLVAAAFIGPAQKDKFLVLHYDGNRANNKLENLRYGSHKDNSMDAKRHGTQVSGERQHAAKLTIAQIKEIRLSPETGVFLAATFGVTPAAISAIRTHKNWASV